MTTTDKATLWSTFTGLFTSATVILGATTKLATAIDDLASALLSQTSIIKDTSANDADIKRLDLQARIAAHKLKLLDSSSK